MTRTRRNIPVETLCEADAVLRQQIITRPRGGVPNAPDAADECPNSSGAESRASSSAVGGGRLGGPTSRAGHRAAGHHTLALQRRYTVNMPYLLSRRPHEYAMSPSTAPCLCPPCGSPGDTRKASLKSGRCDRTSRWRRSSRLCASARAAKTC